MGQQKHHPPTWQRPYSHFSTKTTIQENLADYLVRALALSYPLQNLLLISCFSGVYWFYIDKASHGVEDFWVFLIFSGRAGVACDFFRF